MMFKKVLPPIFFQGVLIFCLLLAGQSNSHAAQWKILETKYLTLRYQSSSDLNLMDKAIDFEGGSESFSSFLGKSIPDTGPHRGLIKKLNAIFEKIQLILDMRKPIKKVSVQIFPDETSLHEMYFKIYKKKRTLRAWYIFEYNTIYVNAKDLFAGMLAHEIAHAIVDNYLSVRPPRATAEILARYVDAHLNEKAKIYN
jgi:hypothetical protein